MEEIDWRLCDKILAAGLWLNRAMTKYRYVPGYDLMSFDGNKALAEASLAIRDANRLMKLKIEKEGGDRCNGEKIYPIKSSED